MAAPTARHRRRDASGHVDPYFHRRRRYEAVLGVLGLAEPFGRMSRRAQEMFWKRKAPDPILVFADDFPAGPGDRALRRIVEAGFRDARVDVDGETITVRDFLSIVMGCWMVLRATPRYEVAIMPEEVRQFWRAARPRLERCHAENLHPAIHSIYLAVNAPLVAHSRLDARLLTLRMDFDTTAGGKPVPRLTVGTSRPQARTVSLDAVARPAYRVATATCTGEPGWVSWTAAQMGRDAAIGEWPVFVQSHALRQLRRRINVAPLAPYAEAWLAESMSEPKIIECTGDDLLVEYRIREDRIGYLVVTPLDDLVVVRTFKFLTMEHTPEARMLERQLRLTRRDVDWLGLHELSAFTQTDLRDDPVLRPLLESCGCGHLFTLDDADYAPEPKAFAAEVRRYLRIAA